MVLGAVVLAGCSSSVQGSGTTSTTDATTAAATCHPPAPARPAVGTPVPGTPSDWDVTSFDGTVIRAHWFPVHPGSSQQYPTVLMGPGWSLSGDTDTQGTGVLGTIPIKALWAAGYNVLTWDPRGFGKSGGEAEVDSPPTRPATSAPSSTGSPPSMGSSSTPGDPRMGMVGGSYGGGIQLVTAATDCRIDAIVPDHRLALAGHQPGQGRHGQGGMGQPPGQPSSSDHVDPEVKAAQTTGTPRADHRGRAPVVCSHGAPAPLVSRIHIPTLFVQGTVDTLFTLQEGVDNYEVLRHHGVPTP